MIDFCKSSTWIDVLLVCGTMVLDVERFKWNDLLYMPAENRVVELSKWADNKYRYSDLLYTDLRLQLAACSISLQFLSLDLLTGAPGNSASAHMWLQRRVSKKK